MGDTTMLKRLKVANFLSFGPEGVDVEFGPLNVIIGANGAGKSNLVTALEVLTLVADHDIPEALRASGRLAELAFCGSGEAPHGPALAIALRARDGSTITHSLALMMGATSASVVSELVESAEADGRAKWRFVRESPRAGEPEAVYGKPVVADGPAGIADFVEATQVARLDGISSVLVQLREPTRFIFFFLLVWYYQSIYFYRGIPTDRDGPARSTQSADLPANRLMADGSNLALVVNGLLLAPGRRRLFIEELRRCYPRVEGVELQVHGGSVRLFVQETGRTALIPSDRWSDGLVRYVALLAVLLDPEPPPLLCIEEPELGLHPDVLAHLPVLLREASERTQLIVTTHSEIIVSRLSDTPEAILIAEPGEQGTTIRRLDREKLAEWLTDDYSLGDLWASGVLGGNP